MNNQNSKLQKVTYIAPEIPSLSTTFIYNEIFALKEKGIDVFPISLHSSKIAKNEEKLEKLFNEVFVLYNETFFVLLTTHVFFIINKFNSYLNLLSHLVRDLKDVGFYPLKQLKVLNRFLYAPKVAKLLMENSCQIIHAHFATAPAQIAAYSSILTGVPFTLTAHAIDIFTDNILLEKKLSKASAVITISNYNRNFLIKNFHSNPQSTYVVRCGVSTSDFVFRLREGLPDRPRIMTLCRLVDKKGVDVLIAALGKLRDNGMEFTFDIVGDGPEKSNLVRLLEDHRLVSISRFLGAVSHEDVPSLLQDSDVFVLAAKQSLDGDRDGIPVALMEAMATGIPVISSQISGIPELVENQVSGLLVEPNNPDALATAISNLAQEKYWVRKFSEQGRVRVVTEFDRALNIERLNRVFERCLT